MLRPRHLTIAALLCASACGGGGPAPPEGELRSTLAVPTVTGDVFDPNSLTSDVTIVTFWSPS